jgi:NAD(P)-dependent dehydrogenase (short-subunit alcohol dehydrogenase family)
MRRELAGARVWVVGASSGIGAALAEELVRRGAVVAISARRRAELEQVSGGRMHVEPVDVTDADGTKAAAESVTAALGRIDVVVISVGVWEPVSVDDWSPAKIREQLDVHVLGHARVIEAVLPPMLAERTGTIVGVASVAAYRGLPGGSGYSTAKAALVVMLESMRAELLGRGVQVVTVCPGYVRTKAARPKQLWMIEPEDAARRIADGLVHSKAEIVFPLPMMIAMKTARMVPVRVWPRIAARLR